MRRLLVSRALWSVLVLACCWSLGRMAVRQLARDRRFVARPERISLAAPGWGGEAVVAPIEERLRALGPLNLFDVRFAGKLRDALEQVPGVRAVREIRRRWPNGYAVDVVLHRPVAVVETRGRTVPVTADAVRLPEGPYERAVRGLVRIAGVEGRPAAAGTVWRCERLADGLATLAQLGPHLGELGALGIATIDVSEADRPLEGVRLLGREGFVACWGRPRAAVGESPVQRKIGYLRLAAQHPDQVWGRQIDLRFDTLYFRDPGLP